MQRYRIIKVFTNENAHWQGKPLGQAVVEYLRGLKIPLRCIVVKGNEGYYETGEIAIQTLLKYNFNLPVKIEIILPVRWLKVVLRNVAAMVQDGIVAVEKLAVYHYRADEQLIPNQVTVREVMTGKVATVPPGLPLDEVVRRMLAASLKSIPVVDEERRVLGMITQENLSDHPHLPLRLGLLARLEPAKIEKFLNQLPIYTAAEIMTSPAVTVRESQQLHEAIDLMLKHRLKRLPVVDEQGRLAGVIARIDILRVIDQQVLRWKTLQHQHITVQNLKQIKQVGQRDREAVYPETPLSEVVDLFDRKEIQRVAVVDHANHLLGIISDTDLLPVRDGTVETAKEFFIHPRSALAKRRQLKEVVERMNARTAGDLMNRQVLWVRERDTVDTAVQFMAEQGLKRLPVVNDAGQFQGMISRDALLRTISKP
ncbi:CBS domain protein [Hydrogenispora ethanolica]|uniref:CBS domain protein n=1 Tax=Hydrogenispora ethanolica TaxID=1082276 RepID=A0A4R1QSK6_HYDET|nr:DUF190 domain-containing protein [Hydrogenispora ethanolica]TCL56818.1 CBS domain protein [Hydrogenispora ethanolica]